MDGLAGYFSNVAAPTDGAASVENYTTSNSVVVDRATSPPIEPFASIGVAASARPLMPVQSVATESSVTPTAAATTVGENASVETPVSNSIKIQPGSLLLDAAPDTTGLLSETAIAQQLVAQQQAMVPTTVHQLLNAVTAETVVNGVSPSELTLTAATTESGSVHVADVEAGQVSERMGIYESAAGRATSEPVPVDVPVDDLLNVTNTVVDTVVAEPVIIEEAALTSAELTETNVAAEAFNLRPDVLTVDATEFATAVMLVQGTPTDGQARADNSFTTVATLTPTVYAGLQDVRSSPFDQSTTATALSATALSATAPALPPERVIGAAVELPSPDANGRPAVQSVAAGIGAPPVVSGNTPTQSPVIATGIPNVAQVVADRGQTTASVLNSTVQPETVARPLEQIERPRQIQPTSARPQSAMTATDRKIDFAPPAATVADAPVAGDQPIESIPIGTPVSEVASHNIVGRSVLNELPDITPANATVARPGRQFDSRGVVGRSNAADPARLAIQSSAALNLTSAPGTGLNSPPAAVPPLTSQILSALVQQHSTVVQDNADSLTLRLDPPELGQLDVKFTQGADGISVRVSADEAVTMEMLLSRGGEIERMLLNQNSEFVKVEFAAPDSDGRSDQSSFSNTQQDGAEHQSEAQDHPSFSQHQTQTDRQAGTRRTSGGPRRTTSRVRLRA